MRQEPAAVAEQPPPSVAAPPASSWRELIAEEVRTLLAVAGLVVVIAAVAWAVLGVAAWLGHPDVAASLSGKGATATLGALAGNGRDALERLQGPEKPDVIVLDLMLPGMDGWQFYRQIRQDPALASVPVIVCSAVADAAREAEKLGAATCLVKPIDTQELLQAIRSCCAAPAAAAPGG